jgi:hypothetical protein
MKDRNTVGIDMGDKIHKEAQCDLSVVKARDELVKVHTALVAHVRGIMESVWARLPKSRVSPVI